MRKLVTRYFLTLFLVITLVVALQPVSADEPGWHERYLLAVICAKQRCVKNPPSELPPGVFEYLDGIWIPLLKASSIAVDETIALYLTYSPEPNALAIKHYWGITAGLWNLRMTKDELAFVAAHELAHIELRHYERKIEEVATVYVVALIAVLLSQGEYNPLTDPYFVRAANLALAAYSREKETEADLRAIQIMRSAGFDPRASVAALTRISALGKTGTGDLFDTHPSIAQRIARLGNELAVLVAPPPTPEPSAQPTLPSGPAPTPTVSPAPKPPSSPRTSSPPKPAPPVSQKKEKVTVRLWFAEGTSSAPEVKSFLRLIPRSLGYMA